MLKLFRLFVRVVLGFLYRVEVEGLENVPLKGPILLCANHNSELDMFFIGMRMKRFVRWMAKEELFRNPLLSAILRWMGAFPIKRGKGDLGSIKNALGILEQGEVLGIFPEGTRVKKKDRNAGNVKIKSGAGMLIAKSGAPVLPVALCGDFRLFGKIRIVFGKPFQVDTDPQKKYTSEEFSEITRKIMDRVYEMMGDL